MRQRPRPLLLSPVLLSPVLLPSILLTMMGLSFSWDPSTRVENAEPLPAELTLRTVDGREVTFGELRGKAVLLDFWATWCAPCRDATPDLARLERRLEGEPFELIGVSVDRDRRALERYLQAHDVTWTQVWDSDGGLARWFGVRVYPTYLVIDHEGRPVGKITGGRGSFEHATRRAVRRARQAATGR